MRLIGYGLAGGVAAGSVGWWAAELVAADFRKACISTEEAAISVTRTPPTVVMIAVQCTV